MKQAPRIAMLLAITLVFGLAAPAYGTGLLADVQVAIDVQTGRVSLSFSLEEGVPPVSVKVALFSPEAQPGYHEPIDQREGLPGQVLEYSPEVFNHMSGQYRFLLTPQIDGAYPVEHSFYYFTPEYILNLLNTAAGVANLEGILQEFSSVLNLDTEIYDTLYKKEMVLEKLLHRSFPSIEAFRDAFYVASVLAELQSVPGWGALEALLYKHSAVLHLDMGKYNSLNDNQRHKVLRELSDKGFNSLEQFRNLFDAVIHAVLSNTSTPGGGSCSSGSGMLRVFENPDGESVTVIRFAEGRASLVLPAEDGQGRPVTAIAAGAIRSLPRMVSLELPDGITAIEPGAVSGCPALENVILPGGLARLEAGAFQNCPSLRNVSVPGALTELDPNAFGKGAVTLYAPEGSWAAQNAEDLGFSFVPLAQDGPHPPMASPISGYLSPERGVTLWTPTPEAEIRFTTDGTEPSAENGESYRRYPFFPDMSMGEAVVKAAATVADSPDSAVSAFSYSSPEELTISLVLGDEQAWRGHTVELPLLLKYNRGLQRFVITLSYDPTKLEVAEVLNGNVFTQMPGVSLTRGAVHLFRDEGDPATHDGNLARVRFRVRADSANGLETPVTISAGRLETQSGTGEAIGLGLFLPLHGSVFIQEPIWNLSHFVGVNEFLVWGWEDTPYLDPEEQGDPMSLSVRLNNFRRQEFSPVAYAAAYDEKGKLSQVVQIPLGAVTGADGDFSCTVPLRMYTNEETVRVRAFLWRGAQDLYPLAQYDTAAY